MKQTPLSFPNRMQQHTKIETDDKFRFRDQERTDETFEKISNGKKRKKSARTLFTQQDMPFFNNLSYEVSAVTGNFYEWIIKFDECGIKGVICRDALEPSRRKCIV